jgi:hypothetical protein
MKVVPFARANRVGDWLVGKDRGHLQGALAAVREAERIMGRRAPSEHRDRNLKRLGSVARSIEAALNSEEDPT